MTAETAEFVATEFRVAEAVIARLRTGQEEKIQPRRPALATPYEDVLGAVDVAGLSSYPKRLPAALVVPLEWDAEETVTPREDATQHTRSVISVGTVIRAENDRHGRPKARADLARILGMSRALLAGWQPVEVDADGVETPVPLVNEVLSYRRGRLAGIDGSWIEWRDEYLLRWWSQSGPRRARPGIPARI